jgi:hypothetical protein
MSVICNMETERRAGRPMHARSLIVPAADVTSVTKRSGIRIICHRFPLPMKRSISLVALIAFLIAGCQPDAARPGDADTAESLHPVRVDGKWGFIDSSGDLVVDPLFDRAWPFSDGLALVQVGDRFGYVHQDGQYAVEPRFHDALFFSEGLAPVQIGDGSWGYIDTNGEFVVEPRFHLDHGIIEQNGSRYDNGLVPTRDGDLYGFRERDGDDHIDARFDNAWYFSDGLARVRVDNQWGYIDRGGDWVIEPRFERAWDFIDGIAMVQINENIGYINRDGEYVWEPTR